MRHWTYLPIVGFSLVFASAGPARASDEAYAVEAVPCPVKLPQENEIEGKTYDCSVVLVPEDHADPESRTIELAVMRLRAATLSPAGDPLIYLSGGPGSSALHEISSNALLYLNMQAMRERRDLLFYDQRGTGHSHLLACGPFN